MPETPAITAITCPVLLTKREAAAVLRISERTLDRLTAPRGPIPPVRLGKLVRYRREALEQIATEREADTFAEAAS
jgi:excisionase family DNA binding protein